MISLDGKTKRYVAVLPNTHLIKGSVLMSQYAYERLNCDYCAFFLSSGTSNERNFPNTWLPFYGIDKNWLIKAGILGNTAGKYFRDVKNSGITINTKLKEFLSRFDFDWQLRISASFLQENSYWDENPKLRNYVLGGDKPTLIIKLPQEEVNGEENINQWLDTHGAHCLGSKLKMETDDEF